MCYNVNKNHEYFIPHPKNPRHCEYLVCIFLALLVRMRWKCSLSSFSLAEESLEGTQSARKERGGLPCGSGWPVGAGGQPSVSGAARAAAVGLSRRGAGL